jgi:hypothetical protein
MTDKKLTIGVLALIAAAFIALGISRCSTSTPQTVTYKIAVDANSAVDASSLSVRYYEAGNNGQYRSWYPTSLRFEFDVKPAGTNRGDAYAGIRVERLHNSYGGPIMVTCRIYVDGNEIDYGHEDITKQDAACYKAL